MASILKLLRVRFRDRPEAQPPGRREHVRLGNPWHAVSIVPCAGACSAAQTLAGQRFLSRESPPSLPLPDCTVTGCTCSYRHHDDRRASRPPSLRAAHAATPQRRSEDPPLQ